MKKTICDICKAEEMSDDYGDCKIINPSHVSYAAPNIDLCPICYEKYEVNKGKLSAELKKLDEEHEHKREKLKLSILKDFIKEK